MREEKIGLGALLGDRDLRTLLYLEGHRAENMRDPYWPVTFGIPRPQFCAATAVTPSIVTRSGLDAGLRACVRNRHPRLRRLEDGELPHVRTSQEAGISKLVRANARRRGR